MEVPRPEQEMASLVNKMSKSKHRIRSTITWVELQEPRRPVQRDQSAKELVKLLPLEGLKKWQAKPKLSKDKVVACRLGHRVSR